MSGKVFLVGAGPGAVDLLTLRAARLLATADIVFHDALVQADVIALAPQARKVAVGKRCGKHSTAQRFINRMLIDAANKHGVVVRLKGGDPMLFGRAQEEIDALRGAGIEVEIVPGITAALAASAQLGVSLTQRGVARSVAFATPRIGAEEVAGAWAASVAAADTGVIYMGVGEAAAIASALLGAGKSAATPVAIIENAGAQNSRVWHLDLAALARFDAAQVSGPALIVLGDVLRSFTTDAMLDVFTAAAG